MKDIYYLNKNGEKIDFLSPPYLLQTADIFDYEWKIQNNSVKITAFERELTQKKLLLSIINYGKESYERALDRLHDVIEKDVLSGAAGRLYFGEQFMFCYITESKKSDWESDAGYLDVELTVSIEKKVWITEKKYIFKYKDIISTNNKRYLNKYPYRYANGMKVVNVQNEAIDSAHFILRFYGPVVYPEITISGNSYTVLTVIEKGEYIEINSMEKTVIKRMVTGVEVNVFHYRGKNVFKKILPGNHDVQCGSFDFDLILLEGRSEPRWELKA